MLLRGLVGSALILVGGLGVATLPGSTPLLRWDLLLAVRTSEPGRMAALTLVMVGIALVAAQWLTLCRWVSHTRGREQDEAITDVWRASLVWSIPLLLAPPLFSRDGWSYAAQGMIAHVGFSPYEHGPVVLRLSGLGPGIAPVAQAVDPRWMDTVTPYGPLPLWLGEIGAGFTGNPWVLVIGHRLVALVGLALLAWAVPRLARWSSVNPALASAIVLASPLMLTNGVGGLHNDLLMVGLMAAALVVAAERGWLVGAVLGGLAAAVKAPGGLVCIGVALVSLPLLVSWRERVSRLAAVAAVSMGLVLALGVLTGLGAGWMAALGVPGTVNTPLSMTTLVGGALDRVAMVAGLDLPTATFLDLVRRAGTVGAIVCAAWVALRWRSGDRADAARAVALVMSALVLLSPVVHLWYLLWVVPFLAVVALSRTSQVALLAVSLVAGLAAPLDSSLHDAYLAIVLGSLLLAVFVLVLLLTRRSRARIERITSAQWIPV